MPRALEPKTGYTATARLQICTELIHALTLYCQGDNKAHTSLRNVCASVEGVNQLVWDRLQTKQGTAGAIHLTLHHLK